MKLMIDTDYHRRMKVSDKNSQMAKSFQAAKLEPPWDPAANPHVAKLLDHLAEELAMEYVRLMELAAEEDSKGR